MSNQSSGEFPVVGQVANVPPTQVTNPRRAVIRTVVALIIASLPLLPVVVAHFGLASVPWIAGTVAVAGGITRLLAVPLVHDWVQDHMAWLAAEPPLTPEQLADLMNTAVTVQSGHEIIGHRASDAPPDVRG